MKYLRFVWVTVLGFFLLVTAKFLFSHRLALQSSGLGGLRGLQAVDYLLVGSSHTRQGYSAEIIEKETGEKSYLLAYDGMDAVCMREVLAYILEEKRLSVDHLVLEAYVFNAVSPFRLKDERLFNDSPPALKRRLLDVLTTKGQGLKGGQLYELLVTAGNESLLAAPFVNSLLSRGSYHGSYVRHHTPHLSGEGFSALGESVPATMGSELNPDQREAYEGLFDLISRHGISARFVETPMPGPVSNREATREAKRQLAELIHSRGFEYVDLGAHGVFDENNPSFFADWNHLSTLGRDTYSKVFVSEVLGGG